jgi:uncharacterized RDD family membrane protein YckC
MTLSPDAEAALALVDQPVSGEAVVLDLRPASFITRALAQVLDVLLLFALGLGVTALLYAIPELGDLATMNALSLVASLLVLLAVPVSVETFTRGKSLGKWAAGLRVVRDDGGPIRARHALIRGLCSVLEIYAMFGSVALICSLMNRRGKRVGDLLAGTYVIRERTPPDRTMPVRMPPQLIGWAQSSDLGRLPDRLALAIRQFLSRAAGLHPEARARLGTALAQQVTAFVAPLPPPGTHPEDFLAAVLAERRRRDHDRLQREARARQTRTARRVVASPLSAIGTGLIEHGPADPGNGLVP